MSDAVATGLGSVDWLCRLRRQQEAAEPRMQPLRLLYVATSTGQGGIERHSVRLAERLAARGALVTYACCRDGFLEDLCCQAGLATRALMVRNGGDLGAALRLARFIIHEGCDVVHVHSQRDFLVSVIAVAWARLCLRHIGRRPRLVLHAHLIKSLGTPVWLSGRFFGRWADAVIAVSEATKVFLTGTHGLEPSFVSVIHNGIDVDAYSLTASERRLWRECLRQQWGIPSRDLVVGMIGRLDAKGRDVLLSVAPQILSQFPDVSFVFVGAEGRWEDSQRLRQMVKSGQFTSHAVFVGSSENIPATLAAFDVLAHLPTSEAFGLTIIEAMAAGIPVVATDVGGCAEIIEDGVTGLLVRLDDHSGLVAALCSLLGRSRLGLNQGTSAAGRRRAQSRFSMAQQVERLEAFYTQLLH